MIILFIFVFDLFQFLREFKPVAEKAARLELRRLSVFVNIWLIWSVE